MQLLFSARETIATLLKYKCKTFITLTPVVSNFCVIHARARDSEDTRREGSAEIIVRVFRVSRVRVYLPTLWPKVRALYVRSRLFFRLLLLLKLQNCDEPSMRKSLLHKYFTLFCFSNYVTAMNRKAYPIRIIIRVHQFWLRIISSMARIRNHKRRRKWFPFLEVLLVCA